jgi:hypothetical protein
MKVRKAVQPWSEKVEGGVQADPLRPLPESGAGERNRRYSVVEDRDWVP